MLLATPRLRTHRFLSPFRSTFGLYYGNIICSTLVHVAPNVTRVLFGPFLRVLQMDSSTKSRSFCSSGGSLGDGVATLRCLSPGSLAPRRRATGQTSWSSSASAPLVSVTGSDAFARSSSRKQSFMSREKYTPLLVSPH